MHVTTAPLLSGLGALFERYAAVRLLDAAALLGLTDVALRSLQRRASELVNERRISRAQVGDHIALTASRTTPLTEAVLIHGMQWSMLDAALTLDGFRVDRGDAARRALRSWLQTAPVPVDTDRMFTASARASAADMPVVGPDLTYSVAWKGATHSPRDLRLVVVMSPSLSRRRQLEALPLRVAGQPRIPVILRPADDGTTVHRRTGVPTFIGPQFRALALAFREHKNPGSFPYWLTAEPITYRPNLWARLDRKN